MNCITETDIKMFAENLVLSEKSSATIKKYKVAIENCADWLKDNELTKKNLMEYRNNLLKNKKAQTVNGELSAINAYLKFKEMDNLKIRFLKVQKKVFIEEKRELSEGEYKRLLQTAQLKGNERLYLLMMSLCSTGIRVSELQYFTVEAINRGCAEIYMKGKCRIVLLPKELCRKLKDYIKKYQIKTGYVFCTKNGRPLDRSNICHEMKKLCVIAKVDSEKVFPHNLRHLFARCFYAVEKNLAHLADLLGHSRIETTRIYVSASAKTHEKILKKMRLVI